MATETRGKIAGLPAREWNETRTPQPSGVGLAALFEAQVALEPAATALIAADQSLTRDQLNRRANLLAHRLLAAGVGRGTLVGVCMERQPALIAALLGIVKAGAAYVPLDPEFPAERLALMLADTSAPVVLTDRASIGRVPPSAATVVVVDDDAAGPAAPDHDPGLASDREDPAYVIYTSGSTGRPKGAVIPQRAIMRLVLGTDYVTLGPQRCIAQISNTSFDAATFEIWGALLTGARLVMLTRAQVLSSEALGRAIRAHGITTMFMTTALFNEHAFRDPTLFQPLEHLMFGGEASDPRAVRHLVLHGAPARLTNIYGPTETTTFAISHDIDQRALAALPSAPDSLPIGRPIANTRAYVLDEAMRPLPVGETGELYIGDLGVGLGYLNAPELTAERFVEDPFDPALGTRLYRTGDLACWLPDGSIAYRGRRDHQVKIRGFRIELGEIETALRACPGVRDALALVRAFEPGDQRLVAVVARADGASLDARTLRQALAARLPSYMVPGTFELWDTLPINANGKVDRQAVAARLAVPAAADGSGPGAPAPQDPSLLEGIARVWADQLHVERVAPDDDFLDLGGHSLKAVQIANRLRDRLNLELAAHDILAHRTVRQLAAFAQSRRATQVPATLSVPATAPAATGSLSYPANAAQSQVAFLGLLAPGNRAYLTQAMLAFRGPLDVDALTASIQQIVDRHEHLRTRYDFDDSGRLMGQVAPTLAIEVPLHDLTAMPASARQSVLDAVVEGLLTEGIDPRQLPLARWALMRVAADDHRLLMIEHHYVHDGWSFRMLLSELAQLYSARVSGRAAALAAPTQFRVVAQQEADWLTSPPADAMRREWGDRLRHAGAELALPFAGTRDAHARLVGAQHRTLLPAALSARLREQAAAWRLTPFQLLFGAWALMLARLCGRDTFLLGTSSANRHSTAHESVLGMLVSMVPVRIEVDDAPVRELLGRIAESLGWSLSRARLPFSSIVEALGASGRQQDRVPLIPLQFSQHDAGRRDLAFDGVQFDIVEGLGNGTAKFDLGVIAIPHGPQGGIELVVEYARPLLEPAHVARVAEGFAHWLQALLADGDRTLVALPVPTVTDDSVCAAAAATAAATANAAESPHAPSPTTAAPPRQAQVDASTIAAVFADVLRQPVQPEDDFFELGGHSLLAARALARLRRAAGTDLPITLIFEHRSALRIAQALRGNGTANDTTLAHHPAGTALPLSSAQQSLWFLERTTDPGSAYNIPVATRIDGPLQVERLAAALRQIVARHGALRIGFGERDAVPLQTVAAHAALELPVVTIDATEPSARERALQHALAAAAREPFDLTRPPLMRARLFRLAPQQHALLLVLHHIVADGWSLDVLAQELSALYAQAPAGDLSHLPAPSADQADFAQWQQQRLADGALNASRDWWHRQLAGIEPLELPTDRRRPSRPSYQGRLLEFRIAAAPVDRLKALAREHGSTLFMGLLAAFQAVLARWSGQTDIAVGSPVAGRQLPELEPMIGYFVNTVVLRTQLHDDPTFTDLLQRVRGGCISAFTHQDYPFDRLVAELSATRDPSRNPLFQVSFALQNVAQHGLALSGAECSALSVHTATSKFDLSMALAEQADGSLFGQLEYATDLFLESTMVRLAGHLGRLLEVATSAPATRLSAIDLVDAAEQRLLDQFATGPAPASSTLPLLQAFARQARLTPRAVAIDDGQRTLDYATLAGQAGALATRLGRLGIGEGDVVGIDLERSASLVIGLLGIRLAGAAWLALDARLPGPRLQRVLEDARPVAMLVADDPPQRATAWAAQRLQRVPVTVPHDPIDPAALDPHLARAPQRHDALAYLMYTSGSTGEPRGVMLPVGALDNHLNWIVAHLSLSAADRVLQSTSMSFDPALWEVFGPLMVGGAVHLAPPGAERDPRLMTAQVRERGITVLQGVPSQLQPMLDDPAFAQCRSLAQLVVGGEAMPPQFALAVAARLPWVRLGNYYGPTEGCVDATCEQVGALDEQARSVPIGRPIAGVRCQVLDARLRPSPIGLAGDLWIGGAGLALGYLNQPTLTRERFVEDPRRPGERLYRTGDRARWLADGRLEHLGRNDDQIKLRGVRIESGDIEAALLAYPSVRAAAVTVQREGVAEPRLVAWLVVADEPLLDEMALRRWLQQRLPAAMVPAVFQTLDDLPRLPSGKIDRRALSTHTVAPARVNAAQDPPRGATEQAVAEIWSELLALPDVAADDNFFDLGGHSLLAYRAAERLRTRCGVDLRVQALFDAPTVRTLAATIDALPAGGSRRAPLAASGSGDPPAPLSPAQEGLWFLDRLNGPSALYNMPFAIRIDGSTDSTRVEAALRTLIERHPMLRTRFASDGGRAIQQVEASVSFALERVDLRDSEPLHREALLRQSIDARARKPFDLRRAPLLRATWIALHDDEQVLLLVLHHIVFDGWSTEVLLRELGACHRALAADRQPELPALPLRFTDYAIWQRAGSSADDADAHAHRTFWRATLAGAPALALPTDRARPAQQSHRGAISAVVIPPALAGRWRTLARQHECTLFIAMLAAFKALLSRWSGQSDIVVGTPVAGRPQAQLEPLVGFFVNTLVLRTQWPADTGFSDLLQRVRASCLAAFSHQDQPFDQLVLDLAQARDPSRNPLFQVSFALQSGGGITLDLGNARGTLVPVHTATAKFDLSLSLAEREDGALAGQFEYATDLFDAATIERLADCYLLALQRLADEPAVSPAQLLAPGHATATPTATPTASRRHTAAGSPTAGGGLHREDDDDDGRGGDVDVEVDAAPEAAGSGGLAARLCATWARVLGLPQVDPDDNFFEIGGHSLLALRLLDAIEQDTGVALNLASFLQAPTVRRQLALLSAPAQQQDAGCVVSLRASGTHLPLFFVSGWGGAILPFKALADALPAQQPLHVLDLTRFGTEDRQVASMQALAAQMLQDLRRIQPHGPYQLAGFSLGGNVVYELAQQLRAAGEEVALLALLDSPAPGYPRRRPLSGRVAMHLARLLTMTPRRALEHARKVAQGILQRRRGHVPRLFDEAQDNGAPSGRTGRALEASADVTLRLFRDYQPAFYPGTMVLVRAGVRPIETGYLDDDVYQGWLPLIGGGIGLRTVPCQHRRMLDAQHAPMLAAVLQTCLVGEAMAAAAPPAQVARPPRRRALVTAD